MSIVLQKFVNITLRVARIDYSLVCVRCDDEITQANYSCVLVICAERGRF